MIRRRSHRLSAFPPRGQQTRTLYKPEGHTFTAAAITMIIKIRRFMPAD
jgi:hypothetical protein